MGLFGDKQSKLNSRFFKATEKNDFDYARELLGQGADINATGGSYNRTPLYNAAYRKNAAAVKFLLTQGADPNIPKENGHTALMESASDGTFEISRELVKYKADVNAVRTDDKWTAMHIAAQRGHGSIVAILLEAGANRVAEDERLNTPADVAVSSKLAALIRGGEAEVVAPAVVVAPTPKPEESSWRLTARDEVSKVSPKPAIGYQLTEIFNFGSGIYTRIAQNVVTNAESQSMRFFDEFGDKSAIEAARAELVKLGGAAPDRLQKPVLPKPGAAA